MFHTHCVLPPSIRAAGIYLEPSRSGIPTCPNSVGTLPTFRPSDAQTILSPLQCAVADKHCVLPVFSRNRPVLSPLEATLTRMLASVASNRLTESLQRAKFFSCNTYTKPGVGRVLLFLDAQDTRTFRRSDLETFRRVSASPIAAGRLWCHNPKRRENSLRSGETTPLPPVSKTTRADIGNCSTDAPDRKSCLGPAF